MQKLEREIERLEAIEEIKQLKARHMYLADAGYPVDELTDLWCDDSKMLGIFTDQDDPAKLEVGHKQYHGREEIRSFWALHKDVYEWCLHLIGSPIIELDDDLATARGKWTWLMLATRPVEGVACAVWLGGTQSETYRKERGAWRFHALRSDVKLVSTHRDGWVPNRYLGRPA